ncbi:GON domain-containing protein [Actinokineospora enzanensis]|uniref:GON domain-containing protein n=1 Tax=Actinokineospora enzanensis TaxID=155975 RepID=UPI00036707AD|nr:GON domain-containing protein [Actinokineospora enzanensis]
MTRISLAFCTALAATTATTTANAAPAATTGLLDSCAAVHALLPGAPDGNYFLATNRYLLGVYCHDMFGTPREYLNLAASGPTANFSQYTAGGAAPGSNTRTTFSKLRLNPQNLTIDVNDLTFATSTGQLTHGNQTVTSIPYGTAVGCNSSANGVANVDLRGTAFAVSSTFHLGGFMPAGTSTASAANQLFNLTGGGYCGWNAPSATAYNPFNPTGSDYSLTLSCTPDGLLRPQPCLDLG